MLCALSVTQIGNPKSADYSQFICW